MQTLHIASTEMTPEIICNPMGSIKIEGRSIPENPASYYEPVLMWMRDYVKNSAEKTEVLLYLDYINSVSHKVIYELLAVLNIIHKMGKEITVTWRYEEGDDEILEEGSVFESKFDMNFVFDEIVED